jgi:hypothetical protein
MTDDMKDQIREAIASNLTSIFLCGRAWSAWSCGTMREDDFIPAVDSETFLDDMADAVFSTVITQLEQAKADAARIDWIDGQRSDFNHGVVIGMHFVKGLSGQQFHGVTLRAAIDAALQSQDTEAKS